MSSSALSPSTTATPPSLPDAAVGDVVWRQLSRHLWVGRSGDRHVGIIEEGRRFTLTDADDSAHRGYISLEAAQSATGSIATVPCGATDAARTAERCHRWSTLLNHPVISTAALLISSALTSAMHRLGASVLTAR